MLSLNSAWQKRQAALPYTTCLSNCTHVSMLIYCNILRSLPADCKLFSTKRYAVVIRLINIFPKTGMDIQDDLTKEHSFL
jgi:hypothetical protein